ncbi:MAG: NTP transferase domain-containing protein [Halobacteriota archaeon]
MQALLMAGGKGQRLRMGGIEKPLLEYKGRPLFEHVYTALERSNIDSTIVVTSPHTPHTTRLAQKANNLVIEAPGYGYIEDYQWAITRLHIAEPVLIIAADLPLVTSQIINTIIDRYATSQKPALAVYVPCALYGAAGCDHKIVLRARHQALVPAAVNIVDGRDVVKTQEEEILIVHDEALLHNINTVADLKRLTE